MSRGEFTVRVKEELAALRPAASRQQSGARIASSSKNFVALYVFITLVSTVAALVLYAVCAAAALKLRVTGKWSVIAVIALLYSIAMFVGAGLEATLWGFGLALAGLPVRAISRRLNGSSRAAEASPAAPPG